MATRTVNPRGQGAALREEILEAAARLLAQSGSSGEITLRAIAREAGIAAPSIYPHFQDRNAIINAVISRAFSQLQAACADAARSSGSGADQLRSICDAYATFAHQRPGEYRILFERSALNLAEPAQPYPEGIAAFDLLEASVRQMVAEGSSTSQNPTRDAQTIWAGLHGLISLMPATPGFPWLPFDQLLDSLIRGPNL